MNLKKELEENDNILIIVPSKKYHEKLLSVSKTISKNTTLYVTLNKTYDALNEEFTKHKINVNNFIFIDAISKTIKEEPEPTENAFYVSSPSALTEIVLTISKFSKYDFDYMVFDSLTNLVIYAKKAPIGRFVSSLINKMKGKKTKTIFFAMKIKEHEEIIKECSMFCDKVLELR